MGTEPSIGFITANSLTGSDPLAGPFPSKPQAEHGFTAAWTPEVGGFEIDADEYEASRHDPARQAYFAEALARAREQHAG